MQCVQFSLMKLCYICSMALSDPKHQKPCFMTERFACKTCKELGDTEKAKNHHTELHRGGKAPAKKSAPVHSQQAQAGAQPLPLPTHVAQPPVWNYNVPTAQPAVQQYQSNTSYYPAENRSQAPVNLTSQPPPVIQSPTIPHHTLGDREFRGPSNQFVRYQGQVSPARMQELRNCSDDQTFLTEVFSVDPCLCKIYNSNPQDLHMFKARHYFQSIMTCLVNLNAAQDVQVVCLSDDGACLNFGRSAFSTENGIPPAGMWSGRIRP